VRRRHEADELGRADDVAAELLEMAQQMRLRQMLAAKAKELDRTIRKLSAMRDGRRHTAACAAPSHMQCPTFRRILRAAASGAIGARRKRAQQPPSN
jgi:hypothetical protein